MKPLKLLTWIGASLILFTTLGCASLERDPGLVTVHVTGPTGAQLNADYWQRDQHFHISAQLPWDFENQQHVSKLQIQKTNPKDVITVEAHYSDGKCQTMLTRTLPPGTGGLSIAVQHGLTMKMISN